MRIVKVLLVLLVLSLAVSITVFAWFSMSGLRIPSTARVKTFGVWCDTDFIDWGFVEPNGTYVYSVRLNSTSNVPVMLYLTTENWIPANVSAFIALDWNYSGAVLEPDDSIVVDLILSVASNIHESGVKQFSFDIFIGVGE